MPREPTIRDGQAVGEPDVEQALLDAQDAALRLRDLAQALCDEEDARRTLRDLKCQLRRAENRVQETHNRVIMLASLARRRHRRDQ